VIDGCENFAFPVLKIHSNFIGSEREAATLALLQKFQAKLSDAREGKSSVNEEETKATDDAKTDATWYAINFYLTQLDSH
jgi:hypothetical protein